MHPQPAPTFCSPSHPGFPSRTAHVCLSQFLLRTNMHIWTWGRAGRTTPTFLLQRETEGGAWLRWSRAPLCLSTQSGADTNSHTNTLPSQLHAQSHTCRTLLPPLPVLTHKQTQWRLPGSVGSKPSGRELEKKGRDSRRGRGEKKSWRGTLWIRWDFPLNECASG